MAFPQTATGVYLEYIGEWHGVYMTAATKSMDTSSYWNSRNANCCRYFIWNTINYEKSSIQFEVLNSVL
jgi:hypothetical protein